MGEDRSPEEVLAECIRDMGSELGTTYAALRNEVAWIHAKWNQYRQLYARSPERVDLLNQVARHFFGVVQTSLLEDVVLHLARLTDPPKSVGKENLTLQRLKLPALIPEERLAAEVGELLESALTACGTARDWRNRHLAHRALALAMASPTDPLPGISREDIEVALLSIRAVLNRLAKYYWNSEVAYQQVIAIGRDADSLVYYLSLGLRAEEQRLERLEKGEILPEDMHFREVV